ncbi:hypothetical protein [Nesterenkonia ebinurensis]|uniref:hypothetical protein n=1 Tax=Nesterenkonia ebinurensis TaxID=2608252 RepID=UPI00123D02EB|nr:hypothetical protein [Nesterenkonia ebinurensis]
MRPTIRYTVPGLVTIAALTLTACGPEDEAPAEFQDDSAQTAEVEPAATTEEAEEPEEADESEQTEEPEEDDDEADSETPGTPTDSTLNHEDAVDTITYPISTSSGIEGEISMGLHSLEVTDQGMLLTMSFVPEYDDSNRPERFYDGLHTARNIDSHLMPVVSDRANMKAYYVPNEAGEHLFGWVPANRGPWASGLDIRPRSGETVAFWAYYPVPEDEIEVVDIAVMDGVQEFRDVEIDWGAYEPGDYGDLPEDDNDE